MPYLDSKIAEKHKSGCKKPKAKRLYIREYGNKGKQIFIPYGITCPSCKVIVLTIDKVNDKTRPDNQENTKANSVHYKWIPLEVPSHPTPRQRVLIRSGYSIYKCTYCHGQNATLRKYFGDIEDWNGKDNSKPIDYGTFHIYACNKCAEAETAAKPKPEPEPKSEQSQQPGPEGQTKSSEPKPTSSPSKTVKRRKELIKEMSKYGDVGECVVCHKPCLTSYNFHSAFHPDTPTQYTGRGRYGGSGLACYYPDGKQISDIKIEDTPFCCNPCNKKHFEQSYKDGNHGKPVTEVGRMVINKYCSFPYPDIKQG